MTSSESSTQTQVALRTLVLTDLVGSTRLVEQLGDARASEVFGEHDRCARDLLARHRGTEIDKTDGFLLLFERPVDGVLYALDYHRALRALSERLGVPLQARTGVHLGELILRENSPEDVARGAKPLEVEGLAKPTAARLMSLATAGQTLMTRAVFDFAERAAVDFDLKDRKIRWLVHGLYRFAGVEKPMEVFEVGEVGVGPLSAPADTAKASRVAGTTEAVRLVLGTEYNLSPSFATPRRSVARRGLVLAFVALAALGVGAGWLLWPDGAVEADGAESVDGVASPGGGEGSDPFEDAVTGEVAREPLAREPLARESLEDLAVGEAVQELLEDGESPPAAVEPADPPAPSPSSAVAAGVRTPEKAPSREPDRTEPAEAAAEPAKKSFWQRSMGRMRRVLRAGGGSDGGLGVDSRLAWITGGLEHAVEIEDALSRRFRRLAGYSTLTAAESAAREAGGPEGALMMAVDSEPGRSGSKCQVLLRGRILALPAKTEVVVRSAKARESTCQAAAATAAATLAESLESALDGLGSDQNGGD